MISLQDLNDIEKRDWKRIILSRTSNMDALIRLSLLESDLESLRIAFEDYLAAKTEVNRIVTVIAKTGMNEAMETSKKTAWSRLFHHAKVFVVCMRRFARLLEATRAHNCDYPKDVASAITLSWKKKKSFFDQYIEARNAIEHIDGEVNGYNKRFINLINDSLEVVAGKHAPITQTALCTVESSWNEIVDAIMHPLEVRVHTALTQRFISLLQMRVETLNNEEHKNRS